MSLVILGKTSDVKSTDFFSEIENKTGVKIESTRNSSDTTSYITSITFTDGAQITYSDNMELYDNDSRLVIVDDKNHLFVTTSDYKGASMKNVPLEVNSCILTFWLSSISGKRTLKGSMLELAEPNDVSSNPVLCFIVAIISLILFASLYVYSIISKLILSPPSALLSLI